MESEREKLAKDVGWHLNEDLWNDLSYTDMLYHVADFVLEREAAVRVDENEYWLRNRALLEKTGETGTALLVDSLQLQARIYTLTTKEAVHAALNYMEHSPVPPPNCLCSSFWTVRQAHKSDCPKSSEPGLPTNASATPQDSTAPKEKP